MSKQAKVFPGKTYALFSATGGAVTTEDGATTLFVLAAGVQDIRPAQVAVWLVPDDTVVTEVFRPAAPIELSVGEGGGGEPVGDYIYYDDNGCIIQSRLEHITDIRCLQYGRAKLQTLTIDAPNAVNAAELCRACHNLTSFTGNLPKVTTLFHAFNGCPLPELNVTSLSELQTAGAFVMNTKIEFFSIPVPKMNDCNYGFAGCDKLTSITSDFPSLTNGQYMCTGNKNLSVFSGGLPALTQGTGMFGSHSSNCARLDLASVQNIAATINDLASQGKTGTIHIGMQSALQSDDETAEINVALATIRAKGWTVNELYRA